MEPFPLVSDRVHLSVPTTSDVDRVAEVCQTADIQRWTVVPSPYLRSDAEGFVEEFVPAGWRNDSAYTWAIREVGEGDPTASPLIGMIGLTIDSSAPREVDAELGYWLAPEAEGRGVMSAAVALVVDWAFDAEGLGAARLRWQALVGNWASRRVAWRSGFQYEGTLRRQSVQRGERHDAWFSTLLPDDPREPQEPWPAQASTRSASAVA